jgi:hypothetical protein
MDGDRTTGGKAKETHHLAVHEQGDPEIPMKNRSNHTDVL